ncbi:MAG: hypothetical protein ACRED1_07040, partial [Limisphaerales bacterium]
MSEFKYACPVCGQHIRCDSSQSGTVMVCPTCFQKIIVPQAPSGEQTLILTGTKAGGERPGPKTPEPNPSGDHPSTRISGISAVVVIVICIAAAVSFVYRGTIFKPHSPVPANDTATNQLKKAAPDLVATPVNDTNWTLDLKGVMIPD